MVHSHWCTITSQAEQKNRSFLKPLGGNAQIQGGFGPMATPKSYWH